MVDRVIANRSYSHSEHVITYCAKNIHEYVYVVMSLLTVCLIL